MKKIYSIEESKKIIKENKFVILYISGQNCSVCTVLKPKVDKMVAQYERIKRIEMNIEDSSNIVGEFSIFTIPAVIGYFDGKEIIREARHISVLDLEEKIKRYYSFL